MWTARDLLIPLVMIPLIAFCGVAAAEHWPDQWWLSPGGEDPEPSASFELYECIPSSRFGSPVESVSGSAELVEIGGAEYVRMSDLGPFEVTVGGVAARYAVGPAHMDLVVLSGQSNSMRFTAPSYYDGPTTVAPGTAFYLGHDGDPQSAEYGGQVRESTLEGSEVWDIVRDDGSMRLAAMYPSFCGDYVEQTGHRLVTVSTGMGGRAIDFWEGPGHRGYDLMANALALLKEVCEGRIVLSPAAVLWWQGEADASGTQEYYLDAFLALLERLEDGTFGFEFPRVTSMLPRSSLRPADDMIPPALAQLDAQTLDPAFTVASDLTYRATRADDMVDNVHFNQRFYGWAGEAFARQLAEVSGIRPVDETIVICEAVGAVQSLPETVTCYGTSGAAFELSAAWEATEAGYEAALSGNPDGTEIREGLTAYAELMQGERAIWTQRS